MDPITISAACTKIADLLAILGKKSKDRETATLVQQIQAHQQIVHTALHEEQAKSLNLEREMFRIEQASSKAIAERDAQIAKLKEDADSYKLKPEDEAQCG